MQTDLVSDLSAGDDLILSSFTGATDKNGNTTLVADHAMSVYGFDASTGMFEIYNPWGTWSGGGQNWDTTFEVGLKNLLADGDTISIANNASLVNSTPSLVASTQSPARQTGTGGARRLRHRRS